uniref:Putative terminase n=1 Tax=viral metagenome TaxID=1070528 RepID=A0A6M3K4R9_9ZZZZ
MPVKYDDFVKRPFDSIEYTQEQVLELKKCSDDIFSFLNYVKIVHPDKGEVDFSKYIFPHQKDMLKKFIKHRFHVCLLPRQISGKTTIVSVFALYYAMFNDNKTIGIVANKERTATMILRRMKRMYESLPVWLKPGVVQYAETSVIFDNNTRIIVSATSPDALRGEQLNLLILDEFAFVPKNIADAFWSSNLPTIFASVESKVIIVSTPNGLFNLFHEVYTKAERGENSFIHTRVNYYDIPGKDEEWAKQARKDLGSEQRFRQEILCTFLGSTNTVIDANVLDIIIGNWKDPILKEIEDKLFIYEKPEDGYIYILGVDSGKGTGNHYSSIQVLKVVDVRVPKLQQVAVFNDNNTDIYTFSHIVNRLSLYYNRSYIMVENNAEGSTVVNNLWWEFENERLVNTGSKKIDLGVRAKRNTKPRAVLLMKKLIEEGSLEIIDMETLNQLTTFIENNNKYYGKDNFDDLISALYWACYIFEMDVFDEKIDFFNNDNKNEEDEMWGVLSDLEDKIADWDFSWMDS